MRKSTKSQKLKVPKITEAEYAAYVTSLKELTDEGEPQPQENNLLKKSVESE